MENHEFRYCGGARLIKIRFKTCLLQYAIYGVLVATMAGCALPVALLANPDGDIVLKYIEPAGFKLSNATVFWVDNPSIPIKYQYMVKASLKDVPASPALVRKVEIEARDLVAMLRIDLPVNLSASLEKSGVRLGGDYKIALQPTGVVHLDNHLGTQVTIKVTVIDREGKTVWTTVVDAKRPYNVIGIDMLSQDRAYVENTLRILMERMRKAELVMHLKQ